MAHISVCMRIGSAWLCLALCALCAVSLDVPLAVTAQIEGMRFAFAMRYDELARKEWSERALRGTHCLCFFVVCAGRHFFVSASDPDFDVKKACLVRGDEI